jgi:hypothetical protein
MCYVCNEALQMLAHRAFTAAEKFVQKMGHSDALS